MRKQYKVKINAPVNKAFDAVDEEGKIKEWMDGHLVTEFSKRDKEKMEGLKFTQKIAGILELEGEVIAYRRPYQLVVGLNSGRLKGTFSYNFEVIDSHTTQLVAELEIINDDLLKSRLSKLSVPVLDKIAARHVKHLKTIAEGQ